MSRRVRFKVTSEELGYDPNAAVAEDSPKKQRKDTSTGEERKLKKRLWFRRKKLERKRQGGGKGRGKASRK
jgi:hypothetical protein